MIPSLQQFGDSWTQDKLERVRKYLVAFTTIMRKQPYSFAYIDAFAGTGYHERQSEEVEGNHLFQDMDEPEVSSFLAGSAKIALQVEPRFNKYIFIEKSQRKADELEKLCAEFPEQAQAIHIERADANDYLQKLCNQDWSRQRAVLFIDPFGMQLSWETLAAIAATKAIDTWILFPVSAVNRLLKRDGEIPDSWRHRLDLIFGEEKWFDVFFPIDTSTQLFDIESRRKHATLESIGEYYNLRLRSIFAGVAENPYTLRNHRRSPLFLLCFAVGNPNPKAVKLALKIAQDILKRDPSPGLF
jgi:three-Cys-motif partner protein